MQAVSKNQPGTAATCSTGPVGAPVGDPPAGSRLTANALALRQVAAAGSAGGLSTRWMIRWGATVIVALCGWIRLQLLIGVRLGWAIEIVLACCMAIAVLLTRPRSTAG